MFGHRSTTVVLLGAVLAVFIPQAYGQDAKAKLTQQDWTVVLVQKLVPVAGNVPMLAFDASGRFTGSGGCNRLMGDYKLAGRGASAFSVGGVASTRMLCARAVMRYERVLMDSLKQADTFNFLENGQLVLSQGGKDLVVLQ